MSAEGSSSGHVTIRELPSSERPRERLRHAGAPALTTIELVAILLRTGTRGENAVGLASRLLARNGGLAGLARASWAELRAFNGMGEAKAAQIKAALELGIRLQALHPGEKPIISVPRQAALLVQAEMESLDQEELRVLLLSNKKQVVGAQTIYRGNVNSAVVRASEVFRPAVRENCPCIIVLHNHPAGDPAPSPEDELVTAKLQEAGRLLDIELIDHIIIGKGCFTSLREQHVGFT